MRVPYKMVIMQNYSYDQSKHTIKRVKVIYEKERRIKIPLNISVFGAISRLTYKLVNLINVRLLQYFGGLSI